jgi:hypothetical protein
MGYINRFDGELTIEPALTWAEVRDSAFSPDNFEASRLDVKIRVEQTEEDTDDGLVIRRSGVALIPAYEDEMKGSNIVEHVQRFIDENPAHIIGGRLDCEGEEAGDLWRLEVHTGRAVKVTPRIIWPDGSEQIVR